MKQKESLVLLKNQVDELYNSHQNEVKTPQRAFIAWSLIHLSDQDITEQEAIDSIVDGNQEKGIDAIYIPDKEGEIMILQGKYHEDPQKKGVKKSELVKLFNGIDWLLDGDLKKIDKNKPFKAKAEEFREAYFSFDYSKIVVIFAAIVSNGTSKAENDEIEKFKNKMKEKGAPFNVEIYTVTELKNALIRDVHRKYNIDLDLNFIGKPYTYERSQNIARSIVGSVRGSELAEIFREYNFRIFDINIRNYLGNGKINQAITRTATDTNESSNFWFYNNGVTLICDDFSFRSLEDTIVRLKNAQVINGCQTVTSLFHAGNDISENVEVLIRIIEKKADINFVRRVTLFANSQNAVRPSDLVGTETIQLELKRKLKNLNYYYETRRGDYKAEKDNLDYHVNGVITLKEAAQAIATTFKQKPGIAKKDTSKLFKSTKDAGIYDEVFSPYTLPEQILVATKIIKTIKKLRLRKENVLDVSPSWLPHSDFFIAALFYFRTFNKTKIFDKEYLDHFIEWLDDFKLNEFDKIYEKFIGSIDIVVKKNETKYGYSHPRFFKTQIEYTSQLKPKFTEKIKVFE